MSNEAKVLGVVRRPLEICTLPAPGRGIYVLFDDGAVFAFSDSGERWYEYPPIPGTEHAYAAEREEAG